MALMSRNALLLREFRPPRLNCDKRAAFAVGLAPKDSIDRRLRNLQVTRNRDFAESTLSLDVAEKRGGGSWHVHAGILYANDYLSMRVRVDC